jgi:hypothetical protein
LGPLLHNLKAVLNVDFMNGAEEPLEEISIPMVLVSFLLVLVIWILNLVDAARTSRGSSAPPEPPPIPQPPAGGTSPL